MVDKTLQSKIEAHAIRQRKAIRSVMEHFGLKVAPWCRRVGISESSLREFLNGNKDGMTSTRLEMLASDIGLTVGQLLDGVVPDGKAKPAPKPDADSLMKACAEAVRYALEDMNQAPSIDDAAVLTVKFYQYIKSQQEEGESLQPSKALAKLYINAKAA